MNLRSLLVPLFGVGSLTLLASSASAGAGVSTYHIGNSLTVDSNINAMTAMAAQHGVNASADRHIRSGTRLEYIVAHPDDADSSFTTLKYPAALANDVWDAVTVQPFFSYVSDDKSSILYLMNYARQQNPANANAQFYIFARWHQQTAFVGRGVTYEQAFEAAYAGSNDDTTSTAAYFDQLLQAVRSGQPEDMKPIRLIPTGHVFAEIDRQIRAGQLTGLNSVTDLYRDVIHLSPLGTFVASTTFYATIYGDDPEGLVAPAAYFPGLDPILAGDLQRIVWDVVRATPGAAEVPEPGSGAILLLSMALGCLSLRKRA